MDYFFTSQRLGFRNWLDSDLSEMAVINADIEVMEYFPSIQTEDQTHQFINRMQKQFASKGFCYFAVEIIETQEFIGFIGLSEQTYQADFTPCIDIGWRINRNFWGKGYATEGARKVLCFAFEELKIKKILSIASAINTSSENVMKKIGMQKVKVFEHSLLKDNTRLKECVLYEINN